MGGPPSPTAQTTTFGTISLSSSTPRPSSYILFQVVNFPPALYEYVTGELGLALVLVLNKVDLAPPALVVAWKHYFHQHSPQLHIVLRYLPWIMKDQRGALPLLLLVPW